MLQKSNTDFILYLLLDFKKKIFDIKLGNEK